MGMYVAYILIFFVYILCRKGNNCTRIAPSLCLIEIGVFKKIYRHLLFYFLHIPLFLVMFFELQ